MSINTQKIDAGPEGIESLENELKSISTEDFDYTAYWTNLSLVSIDNYLDSIRDHLLLEQTEALEKFCVLSDRYDDLVARFNDDRVNGLTVDILELTGDVHRFAVVHTGARSFDGDDSEFFDQ